MAAFPCCVCLLAGEGQSVLSLSVHICIPKDWELRSFWGCLGDLPPSAPCSEVVLIWCVCFICKDGALKSEDSIIAVMKNLSEPQQLKIPCFLAKMSRVALALSPFLALMHVTFLGRRNHFLLSLICYSLIQMTVLLKLMLPLGWNKHT